MKRIILIVLILMHSILIGQVFVGQIRIHNEFIYTKIEHFSDTVQLSMPYLDGNKKYFATNQNSINKNWSILRDQELMDFETKKKEHQLIGEVTYLGQNQSFVFNEQIESIDENRLNQYIGTFSDENNLRTVLYIRFGYLHIMSPYSQETMSLKHIGKDQFWSVSGEKWSFENRVDDLFQKLIVSNQFGFEKELVRIGNTKIEELWLPIGEDTLFAKLFIPPGATNNPGCLILPGGGPVGMENYEYEARFFAAHGIVSLIFDKSGNGKSKGMGNFNRQTLEEKNDQYLAVFRYLRQLPYVNKEKVGIHGPSEGGRLAFMMAIDLQDSVAFVNSVAAPIVNMLETQLYAFIAYHRAQSNISEADLLSIKTLWYKYFKGIVAGEIDPNLTLEISRLNATYNRLFLPPESSNIPASPTKEDLLNNRTIEQGRSIKCHIYMQYGENDERVNQEHNLFNALRLFTNHPSFNYKVYQRGNHSFMTPEYQICTGYANDKITWLRSIGIIN